MAKMVFYFTFNWMVVHVIWFGECVRGADTKIMLFLIFRNVEGLFVITGGLAALGLAASSEVRSAVKRFVHKAIGSSNQIQTAFGGSNQIQPAFGGSNQIQPASVNSDAEAVDCHAGPTASLSQFKHK